MLVWDGEGAIGRWRAGRVELTARVPGLPRHPRRRRCSCCKPARARSTRASSSGRTTTWSARSCPAAASPVPADFNTQLQQWLPLVNARRRRALGCAPTDRITADRQAMLALPPVAPATGWRASLRLPRDHYVRLDSNDYSVHPARDRPPHRGHRRPAPRPRALRRQDWSPTTSGSGPGTRPSPTPTTSPPRSCCAASGSACCARSPNRTCRSAAWPTTTPPSASTTARRRLDGGRSALMADRDDHDGQRADRTTERPRPDRRGRVPDPGAEGADAARVGAHGSPNAPAPSPGRTRSSSSPACNARSPPASPTAARAASAPPASRPARAWRSSTSTTPAASNAT